MVQPDHFFIAGPFLDEKLVQNIIIFTGIANFNTDISTDQYNISYC